MTRIMIIVLILMLYLPFTEHFELKCQVVWVLLYMHHIQSLKQSSECSFNFFYFTVEETEALSKFKVSQLLNVRDEIQFQVSLQR